MKLLDLFCGAGGAAVGYSRAGFTEIVGVDIVAQKRYPFAFVLGDALEYLADCGKDFDVIHASPPCQQHTPLRARQAWREYPDFLPQTRAALHALHQPWIIENVPGSPMSRALILCGGMFGLRTYRHRWFETSWLIFRPDHPRHTVKTSTFKRRKQFDQGMNISITGDVGSWLGPACMGINWMTGDELAQAIPPAYTEFIGRQLLVTP